MKVICSNSFTVPAQKKGHDVPDLDRRRRRTRASLGQHGLNLRGKVVDGIAGFRGMIEAVVPWESRWRPSGERLHFAMENHHAINGKIHYNGTIAIMGKTTIGELT